MQRVLSSAPRLVALALALGLAAACAEQHENPAVEGRDIKLTFLHTSDMHSRLLPFRMEVTYTDEQLGLDQENEPFGGAARLAWLIHRERQRNERTVYLDTGDFFQGAPIFNAFKGEAEVRMLSFLNPDCTVLGNHEFDNGLENLTVQLERWATFPVLAANYLFVPGNRLGDLVKPYVIVQTGGLKLGIIGLGNFSSLSSLTDVGNSLGIVPINMEQTLQYWIDFLEPQVDLIVVNSHGGFSEDEDIVRCTRGIDVLFGGHTHLALNPPKMTKAGDGRDILIIHSGAFAKYLGKLDVVVRDGAIVAHEYELLPVDNRVPEDPKMLELMEPYRLALNQMWDLTSVFGYTSSVLTKYGYEGGDSALGNLVAEAMRQYARVDLAFNNTLGIRSNIYPGIITFEDLFNVFPFENTVSTLILSGRDLEYLLDYNTERSAGRGCTSQLQVSGVEFTMDCNHAPEECLCWYERHECPGNLEFDEAFLSPSKCEGMEQKPLTDKCREACLCPAGATLLSECRCPPFARDIRITTCPDPLTADPEGCTTVPLVADQLYEVATNDYLATGGSGFVMLRSNSTQVNTGVPIREAVLERIISGGKCIDRCLDEHGRTRLRDCPTIAACVADVDAYYAQYCEDLDVTSDAPRVRPERCVVPPIESCSKTAHCYDLASICPPGSDCQTCTSPGQCEAGQTCLGGHCVPDRVACVAGECVVRCTTDADCQEEALLPDRFSLCVEGACEVPGRAVCDDDSECSAGTAMCLGTTARCAADADCDGQICRRGYCQPERTDCSTNAECPEGVVCAFGYCLPDAVRCEGDVQCPGGACVKGACNAACGPCARDADCPDGLVCSENFCVAPAGRCLEHRCRAFCSDDRNCGVDEGCEGGLCTPTLCTNDQSPETNCRVDAHSNALERCLQVPCAQSEVDGRIQRILPENLEGYHTKKPVFDDPEDIDDDYLGGGGE